MIRRWWPSKVSTGRYDRGSDCERFSIRERALAVIVHPIAPPLALGFVVAATFIIVEAVVAHLLDEAVPGGSFGAVMLFGVLVIAAGWGFGLALLTSLASAAVYVYFHLEDSSNLIPSQTRDLAAVLVFLPLALLASVLAGQARLRAAEANQRRREADLAAELARLVLRAGDLRAALDRVAERLAEVFELPYVGLELDAVPPDQHRRAFALRDGTQRLGTLLVSADLPSPVRHRLGRRIVPSLEALLAAARDREATNSALERSRKELERFAEQQAALRRIATVVAHGVPIDEVLSAVVAELSRFAGVQSAVLTQAESDGMPVTVSTGGVGAADDQGSRAEVEVPIIAEGRPWGAIRVSAVPGEPLPADIDTRVQDFTDLVATAITNAVTRAELTASRARIVAAGDDARRRFERDLHDGAQQRLVSLGLALRTAEATVPPELPELRKQLSDAVSGLVDVSGELQEISRGIHPAIAAKGGVGPAVRTLARQSAVPVNLDVIVDRRLADSAEVAAYYVVAEALTNAAKHSRATEVAVRIRAGAMNLSLDIRDDGIGGADPARGSGLIGLRDRVEALGGSMECASPAGCGTSLLVNIPLAEV